MTLSGGYSAARQSSWWWQSSDLICPLSFSVSAQFLQHLSLKMMVSPLSSVTASKLNAGSHLFGASGLGFTFFEFGFGPVMEQLASLHCSHNSSMTKQHKLRVTFVYFPTIERLNAFNVIFGEQVTFTVRVDGVHQGTSIWGMGHTECVA